MQRKRPDAARESNDDRLYWIMNTGEKDKDRPWRRWEDCRKYGYMAAGGGRKWRDAAMQLNKGDKVFAYVNGCGYVGLGEVTAGAAHFKDFKPSVDSKLLSDLQVGDSKEPDVFAAVTWIKTVDRKGAVLKNRSRRGTITPIRQKALAKELLQYFGKQAE